MQTSLRKMGNSTGLIVPRALLGEIGVSTGAAMDLRVVDGKLVATPISTPHRAGWEQAAEALGNEDNVAEWLGFGNEGDEELSW